MMNSGQVVKKLEVPARVHRASYGMVWAVARGSVTGYSRALARAVPVPTHPHGTPARAASCRSREPHKHGRSKQGPRKKRTFHGPRPRGRRQRAAMQPDPAWPVVPCPSIHARHDGSPQLTRTARAASVCPRSGIALRRTKCLINTVMRGHSNVLVQHPSRRTDHAVNRASKTKPSTLAVVSLPLHSIPSCILLPGRATGT